MKSTNTWLQCGIAALGLFASTNALPATDMSRMSQSLSQAEQEAKKALPKTPNFPHTGDVLLERLLKITAGAGAQSRPGFVDDAFDVSAWPWRYQSLISGGYSRVDYNLIPAEDDWYIHLREIDKQAAWAFQMSLRPSSTYGLWLGGAAPDAPKAMCISEKKIIAAVLHQGWQLKNGQRRNADGKWIGLYSFAKGDEYSIIMRFLEPKQNDDPCLIYISVN